MHPHLRTQNNLACSDLMQELEDCHAKGFLYRCFGNCNDIKIQLNKCLHDERLERMRKNREQAKINRARIEAKWKAHAEEEPEDE